MSITSSRFGAAKYAYPVDAYSSISCVSVAHRDTAYQAKCGSQWLAAINAEIIVPVKNVNKTGTLADALGESLMPAAKSITALTTSVGYT